ncbi:phosphodiesterase [Pontivivens ytuae]|uniref:Phosphodiesterase n=1 Tax=Pontivivens ytuae TaxID=2789856 RepID=A0A7S9LR88_9RHOB|nr:phosphodiesterase [Pontivivens ytuae]QPH53651.1 phosphodiesterase [Pontivivens ytuae]
MKLLHLTDIHLTTPGNTIAGRDPNANFTRALEHAVKIHPDAEAIVITGDLSDWGERDDYVRLRDQIADLPLPVHLCIGNHDDRETFLSVFPDYRDTSGFAQRVVPLSLGHAVLLDTWEAGTHAGTFCAARAEWLDTTLSALPGPVWLFLHHNPLPLGIAPFDEIMLLDADRLGEVLERHTATLRHVFHGHTHLTLSGSFRGVPLTGLRGTNHAGWPDFEATQFLAGSDLNECYGVVLATETGTLIHQVEFGYDGEIRREGSPDKADWDRLTMVR